MIEKMAVSARYGGVDFSYASFEKASVVIIPVPYEETVTYRKGAKNGPSAIFEASHNMELFDEELNMETHKIGIHTMAPLDAAGISPEAMVEAVYKAEKEILNSGKLPVLIGGEHTVSIGAVKAAKEVCEEISVLQLDAHYDLRDEYKGSKNNHACVGRRVQELAPLVQLGVRSISREEKEFLSRGANNRVKSISAYDILSDSLWDKKTIESLKK
ncbi:MAG: arginase family protein, partial [Candidatus Omnitrophota bacterium]|nr:arginase family protein [Candidatus Omnitrophota bacterium]